MGPSVANATFATMVGKDKSPMLKAALEQGRTMLMKKRTKMKTACSVVTSAVLALSLALTPAFRMKFWNATESLSGAMELLIV